MSRMVVASSPRWLHLWIDVSRVIVADSKKVVEPGVRDGAVAAKPAGGAGSVKFGRQISWGNSDARGVRKRKRLRVETWIVQRATNESARKELGGWSTQLKCIAKQPSPQTWRDDGIGVRINYYASDSLFRGLCFGTSKVVGW